MKKNQKYLKSKFLTKIQVGYNLALYVFIN